MSFKVVFWSGSGSAGAVAGFCFRNRAVEGLRQGLARVTTFAFIPELRGGYSFDRRGTGGRNCENLCRLGFVNARGVVAGDCKISRTCASRLICSAVEMEATSMGRRCAIITGVARPHGIGRHLVYGFMGQGYNVVGVDVEKPKQDDERIRSENFHFVRADVSVSTEAERIVQETVQRYGDKIHVLINNAAKLPHSGASDPLKEFTDTIAVNLIGAYALSQSTLPHMPAGNSSIIHMSSTRAHQSEPDTAGYSASKAGLYGLTHSQAITLAGKVRVNTVLPGWINTDEGGAAALRPEDHAWHPVGRVGVPQDVVEMCLFLCDEQRGGFLTGQEFVVDGGVTKKMVYPE